MITDLQTGSADITHEIADSLTWIVTFCQEHPEWFGKGDDTQGAEFEWLKNAKVLLRQFNDSQT